MEEKQKKFAVWSLILGIVGLIFGCMFLGLPAAIIAIILGVKVLGVSRDNKERHMAVAGIITGAVGILFAVIMAVSVDEDRSCTGSFGRCGDRNRVCGGDRDIGRAG